MAKHKRKPAKGKPITAHQLFPAVVALWFGALFGLGSLAMRPALLEELVLKSHLDLVIPAAAPPLGVTARILVALILAALGAMIGIALARRIARPKPVVTERKRSGRDLGRSESAARPRYADASTRPPVLAGGDYGDEVANPGGGGVLANRRRSLAIEHEEEAFVPHEMAPLPGGNPQVFDISELRMEEPQTAPEPFTGPAPAAFAQPQPAPVNLDWSNAAPLAAPAAPIAAPSAIEAQRQVFQAEPEAAPQQLCPATEAAHADGRQVFGMSPPAPPSEAPRQIFGMEVTGDHVAQDVVKAAGFKTTVFEQDEPEPLFGQRRPPVTPQPEAPLEAAVSAPIPQAFEPAAAAQPIVPPMAAAPQAPVPEAPQPSPANPGITDLAARLAESMRRRRAARASEVAPEMPVGEVQPPAAAPLEPAPAFAPAPVPQSFEPAPAAAPVPQAYQPPSFAAAPEAPPAAPALPRAMQPLALDAFIEEDTAIDPSLLPPRHIVMPVAPVPAAPAAVSPEPTPLELGTEDELAEEPGGDENYASLLEIAPARNPFVRIEEPEAARAEVEPVVIFPGQASAAAVAAPAAPLAAAPEPAPFRRFDGPAAAGQGQAVAVNVAPPAVEQGEAEQALRAALSNLQRMSGAA
ncbi:MAG: hypothetical protein K2W91_09235 [Novosphingobium sp.]|nr:hypothetical protein [Novosphingobium sp.]